MIFLWAASRDATENSEYLPQRRKACPEPRGRGRKALSFRPKGEISPRSLASTRDDGPWPVTWRLGASNSPFSCTRAAGKFAHARRFSSIAVHTSSREKHRGLVKAAVAVARG